MTQSWGPAIWNLLSLDYDDDDYYFPLTGKKDRDCKSKQILWVTISESISVPHPSCRWSFKPNVCQSCRAFSTLKCSKCHQMFYCCPLIPL